ncbi:MAG: hypothetical protein M3O94_06725 [Actinomycetota bacterium]|nr:hypothetical protein [Actinomycetota bacterium]
MSSGDLDTLSGRILSADDPFDDMLARLALLCDLDARTLRVRTYGEHGPLSP